MQSENARFSIMSKFDVGSWDHEYTIGAHWEKQHSEYAGKVLKKK